jgi:hypothetical protein
MAQNEYRSITLGDYEAVRRFLADLGWERRVSDPARFAKMMERADRTMVARDGRPAGVPLGAGALAAEMRPA